MPVSSPSLTLLKQLNLVGASVGAGVGAVGAAVGASVCGPQMPVPDAGGGSPEGSRFSEAN